MEIKIISYIPSIIGVTLVGFFVYLSSSKNIQNIIFSIVNFLTSIWLFFLFLTDISSNESVAIWLLRLALFVGTFVFMAFFLFAIVFPRKSNISNNKIVVLLFPGIITAFVSLTSLVVKTVSIDNYSVQPKLTGPLYVVTDFISIFYLVLGIIILMTKYKKSNSKEKKQIQFVLYGLSIAIIMNLFTGVLLTYLNIDSEYVFVGGLSLLVFSLVVSYSIIKHKLFNVRLIVAKVVAYSLLLGSTALIFALIVIIVPASIIGEDPPNLGRQLYYTVAAVMLAFGFQPLKRFFDRLTNKLFYRDAYDSQELLDGLNKILVSTLDINKLLKDSAEEINKSIRSEFVLFGIKKIEGSPQRIVGTNERQFSQQEIEFVRTITPKIRQKSIIVDELEGSEPKLREVLHKNGIALLVRLTDTPNKVQEGLGYIVLGDKKSGGQYTKQDLQVLEIIADELVIAIQNALRFEEIQNFNITLQEKVDDATKKLRSANHRLIELDQTKDDFISMASHQLRTPLTTIKGYLSMVIEGDVGKVSNKQAELLSKAFISSQQMVYLIADLLNVSRLRTGKFVIEPKETNLSDVIGGEIDQLIETAKAKGLELRFENPKNFPTLMLDETKIRQVIMNFIDNAIYYTPAGGHVTVAIQDKGESIEFTVVDDGIGVPKNEQHHLFTKFYRAGNAKKARPDGTGLGLFMAKKVIIAQGGSIIFKSQEGKGSEFGFLFDKAQLLPENYKGALHKTTS